MTRLLPYYGSKLKIAPWIIGMMPEHQGYVEPFAGSLSVLLQKPIAKAETVNDIDGDVTNFFRVLRDYPDELTRLIELTPYSRQEFETAYSEAEDPIERARQFAVRCWMSMGARISGRPTGFARVCKGNASNRAALWSKVPDLALEAAQRLKNVQIENRDALQLIKECDAPDVLIYCDPPYISAERTNANQYLHEMDEAQHRELLQVIKASSAMIMLSGYSNPLYEAELQDWYMESLTTTGERGPSAPSGCG